MFYKNNSLPPYHTQRFSVSQRFGELALFAQPCLFCTLYPCKLKTSKRIRIVFEANNISPAINTLHSPKSVAEFVSFT